MPKRPQPLKTKALKRPAAAQPPGNKKAAKASADVSTDWRGNKPKRPATAQQQQTPGHQKAKADAASLNDWVTALAQQSTETAAQPPSKAARVAKRAAKRQRTDERRAAAAQNKQQEPPRPGRTSDQGRTAPPEAEKKATSSSHHRRREVHQQIHQGRLQALTEELAAYGARQMKRGTMVLATADRKPRNYLHTVQHQKRVSLASEAHQQPRKSAYGGLGLARPTLLLSFADPNWPRRLAESFAEHITGWSGPAPMAHAMKRQRDGNLLWRRLLREKQESQKGGKPPASADARAEAMWEAGDLM
jgi:hypothetical protein